MAGIPAPNLVSLCGFVAFNVPYAKSPFHANMAKVHAVDAPFTKIIEEIVTENLAFDTGVLS